MTAHQLWLWLHEAMQGIPAWGGNENYHRRVCFETGPGFHNFMRGGDGLVNHVECFGGFVAYLRGSDIARSYGAPEAAIHLLRRARAAWNGQVYGDERDDEIEAKRMKEGG